MGSFEEAKINSIVIIESLFDDDQKTGTELYNDRVKGYIEYHRRDEMHHELQNISSKTEFIELLKELTDKIDEYPPGLLIHVEAHGSSDKSGIVFSDSSLATWKEIQDSFISLNVKLNNQLYISLATCFGRNFYKTIDYNKKSPFRAFISASAEVYPDEIIEDYGQIFEELIDSGDLIKAYISADQKGTRFFYKDARVVTTESYFSLEEKLKDPEFKESFLAKTQKNWDKIKLTENLPPFECLDFEQILELVKIDLMNKITKNFFFDNV